MLSPLAKHLQGRNIILASASPRRRELLGGLGVEFAVGAVCNYNETYPPSLAYEKIPEYIAEQKALHYFGELKKEDILITSDTIVAVDSHILGKPHNRQEAKEMLSELSGRSHTVITGLCLKSSEKKITFSDTAQVLFDTISEDEMNYYIDNFSPYDKAGGYAVQEWIGLACIKEIRGSVYTVMGLPVNRLYRELISF